MKRTGWAIALAILVATSAPAAQAPVVGTMTVRTFLAKVARLKALGPSAVTSPDLAQVKDEVRAAGVALKQDSDAREKAGKPPLSCPPKGTKMTSGEFLGALEALPSAARDVPLRQGFAFVLARRYPCTKRL